MSTSFKKVQSARGNRGITTYSSRSLTDMRYLLQESQLEPEKVISQLRPYRGSLQARSRQSTGHHAFVALRFLFILLVRYLLDHLV